MSFLFNWLFGTDSDECTVAQTCTLSDQILSHHLTQSARCYVSTSSVADAELIKLRKCKIERLRRCLPTENDTETREQKVCAAEELLALIDVVNEA